MNRILRCPRAAAVPRASFLALVLAPWCVAAHAAAYQPDITMLTQDIAYDVHADGTYTKDLAESWRIDTEKGVREDGEGRLSYSTALQALEVTEAYTLTKDGRRIAVEAGQIREQQSPESARAPMFDDHKVKVVVFPAVEVGATLVLHSRLTQKLPIFPGQFSAMHDFTDDVRRESMHLTVRAPAAMPLQADAVDLPGGRAGSDAPDTQLWRWSLSGRPARMPELSATAKLDHSPRVAITSFADYAQIGAAYQQRALARAAVTPRVRALAEQLTWGVSDRRRQAEILYDWVSTQIRYVAIHLGFGGVVPHDADAILAAGYGDCKDHVTLLEALLAARSIRSEPVLIHLGSAYWVPKVALPLGVFDHVISWLPEFGLYLDSTAGFARFGVLPPGELGKTALVAGGEGSPGGLRTLPLANPEAARVSVTTRLSVDREGTVTGHARIENGGYFDLAARQLMASVPPGMEEQLAERVLFVTGQDGSGTYHHGDVRDLTVPFDYGTEFRLPDYALLPGPGAFKVPPGLGSLEGISGTFMAAGPSTRQFPIVVPARHLTEISIITLPASIRVPRLPQPVSVSSPLGTYTASYRAKGATVTVRRELWLAPPGPVITPADYPAFRKLALAVKRDLRTQLVY
ncbi:DUF3857 domain-containing protein [Burkholderia glumae]|uniref:DUF3857 domain-containing protein n=1 Tax=Burkholderia glumae TaxID=337 RepID=UPI00157A2BE8|nr:DUF3857 domain-containing protein [Burkholderia glumae]MCR1767323.1 DUF3857 domain-containing protein [Burkholderia glumae]